MKTEMEKAKEYLNRAEELFRATPMLNVSTLAAMSQAYTLIAIAEHLMSETENDSDN